VSNGGDILPGVDGRSLVARRYRDITSALASDQGGADRLSEARRQLIRRFAVAAVLAEQIEARPAKVRYGDQAGPWRGKQRVSIRMIHRPVSGEPQRY
jgi:hypothetical protein